MFFLQKLLTTRSTLLKKMLAFYKTLATLHMFYPVKQNVLFAGTTRNSFHPVEENVAFDKPLAMQAEQCFILCYILLQLMHINASVFTTGKHSHMW